MKKPNFGAWMKKQRKIADGMKKSGDHLGVLDALAPVLKELGKRYDRQALANYRLTGSIEEVLGERPKEMDESTESEVQQAIKAYALAGKSYEKLGDAGMAERMYRKAGDNKRADEIKSGMDRRMAGMAKEYGMEDVLTGSLALIIVVGGLFLFGANVTGNVVGSNFFSSFGFGLIFLFVSLVGVYFIVRKIKGC